MIPDRGNAEKRPIRVAMVTGAYAPEFSAGGLQTQAVAHELRHALSVEVLTTAKSVSLPASGLVDGVPVSRVRVSGGGWAALRSTVRMLSVLLRMVPRADIVHLQGYSSKNILVSIVARIFGRPVIVHLQTARHDEPPAIRAAGRLAWWSFAGTSRFISVSPALADAAAAGGIRRERITVVPNGVDINRFTPATEDARRGLRIELGLPVERPLVLFVGVISPDKQPHILLEAWATLQADAATASTLVFVGATNPELYELGDRLVDSLRGTVANAGLGDRVRFVEPTPNVERYFRAADMLVMPSLREGCPNVLLEAMSSGLPVVASRLSGSTDAIVDDGENGLLVDVGDVGGFAAAIKRLLQDREAAAVFGLKARQAAERHFALPRVARRWLEVYREVLAA